MTKQSPENNNGKGSIRRKNTLNILEAAELEFVKHGFKGATMQAIADRASLPKANLHYYFKNKLTLYNSVLENIMETWNEALSDMSVEDDPSEVLSAFIRKKVDLAIERPLASKLFALEVIQGAPHVKEHLRTDLRKWVRDKTEILSTWISEGKMKPVDPVHLIFLIWSSTQHYADFETQVLTITNRREYEPEDIEHITQFLSSIILGGCGLEYHPPKEVESPTPVEAHTE